MAAGNMATKFCSDWLSGSHFILQTSKFLFINVTVVILDQGHQKVIQYIFPDLYFLCPKYLRFIAETVLTWGAKVIAAAAADADEDAAAETNWKHKITPDWSDLIYNVTVVTVL